MTDWNLVSKGWLGIYWIMLSNNGENAKKTMETVYAEHCANDWPHERLLNPGVLMMASYLLFVYPQQADFDNIDYSEIDVSDFKIIAQQNNHSNTEEFCRRLRNSIAHARFSVDEFKQIIYFHDFDWKGNNRIEFEIGFVEFGLFIDKFAHIINEQMIKRSTESFNAEMA